MSVAILDQGWLIEGSKHRLVSQGMRHRDFAGQQLHFLQIGLGTNTTFVQNMAGEYSEWSFEVDWLVQATSQWSRETVRGVGVEPVRHLIRQHTHLLKHLPNVELVQVAVSDGDRDGMHMHLLPQLLQQQLLQRAEQDKKDNLEYQLEFLRNMSSLGHPHPEILENLPWFEKECGSELPFEMQPTDVWSYGKLAKTLNFVGCEVLMIDAEGHDTRILQSLIRHCQEDYRAWPQVIQFETLGHCDRHTDYPGESEMIGTLVEAGYLLVGHSNKDSYLVSNKRKGLPRLQKWLQRWRCDWCYTGGRYPYDISRRGTLCPVCVCSCSSR